MMDSVDVAMDVDVGKDGALVLHGAGEESCFLWIIRIVRGAGQAKKDNESNLRVLFFCVYCCLLPACLSFPLMFVMSSREKTGRTTET